MSTGRCRLFAFLLVVCLVMALAPAVLAAGTEVSGETEGGAAMNGEEDVTAEGDDEPEAEGCATPEAVFLSGEAGDLLNWLKGDEEAFTLDGDIEVGEQEGPIEVSGNKTLDLAGHKLTFAEHTGRWLELAGGASLTVYGSGEDRNQDKPEEANIIFSVIRNDREGAVPDEDEIIYAGENSALYFYGVYIHAQNAHGPAKAVSTAGTLTAANSVFELDVGTCELCADERYAPGPCEERSYNALYGDGGDLTLTNTDVKVRVLQEATESRVDENQPDGIHRKATYCHALTRALETAEANVTANGGSFIIEDDAPDAELNTELWDELSLSRRSNTLGASSLYAAGTGNEAVTLNGTRISFDPYMRQGFNYGIRCDKVDVVLDDIDFQAGTREVEIDGFKYCYLNSLSSYNAYGIYLEGCGSVDIRNIADGHFRLNNSGGGVMVGIYMNDCDNVTIRDFGEKGGEDRPSLTEKRDTVRDSEDLLGSGLTMFRFSGSTHVTEMRDIYFTVNGEILRSDNCVCGIDVEDSARIDAIENIGMECRTTKSEWCVMYSGKYAGYGIYQNGGTIGTVKNVDLDLYYGGMSGVFVARSTGDNMDVDGMNINLHDLYGVWMTVYGVGNSNASGSIKALNDVRIAMTLYGDKANRIVVFKGLYNGNKNSPISVGENFTVTVPADASYEESTSSSNRGCIYYSKSTDGLAFYRPDDSTVPLKPVKKSEGGNDIWSLGYPPREEGGDCVCDEGCTDEKWHHYCPVCSTVTGTRSDNACQAFVRVSSWAELRGQIASGTAKIALTRSIEADGGPATVPEGQNVVIRGITASGGDPTGAGDAPGIRRMDTLRDALFKFEGDSGSLTLNNVRLIGRENESEDSATEHAVIELKGANELTLGEYSSILNSDGGAVSAGSETEPFSGRITMKDDAVISGHQVTGKNGGAVCVYGKEDDKPEIVVGAITDCSAGALAGVGGQGGAIWAKNAKVTVGGVNQDNRASGEGGFIYAENCEIDFTGGTCTGKASGDGGAAYIHGGTVIFSGGASLEDSAAKNGAGLYLTGGVAVTLDSKVKLTGNAASEFGGGIYAADGTVTVTGAAFTGNTASGGKGGGIYLENGAVNITGGTYTGNTADAGSVIYAGAGATLSVTGGTMKNSGGVNDNVNAKGTVAAHESITAVTVGGGLDLPEPAAGNGHGVYLAEGQKLTLQSFTGGRQICFFVDAGARSDIQVTTNKLSDKDTDVLRPESGVVGLRMEMKDDAWHLTEPASEEDPARQRFAVEAEDGTFIYYYDLADAFAKLGRMTGESTTIKVIKDDGEDRTLTLSTAAAMRVPEGKTATLDLNGYTIDATTSVSELFTVDGTLNVVDETVKAACVSGAEGRGAPENAGSIVLHDAGDDRRDLFHVNENGVLNVVNVSLKVTKPEGDNEPVRGVGILLCSNAELTLKNSTVEAPWYGVTDIAEVQYMYSGGVDTAYVNQGAAVKSIENCVIIQTNIEDDRSPAYRGSGAALSVGPVEALEGDGRVFKEPAALGPLVNSAFEGKITGAYIACRFEKIENCDIKGGSSFGLYITRDGRDTDRGASGDIINTKVYTDRSTAICIDDAVAVGVLSNITAGTSDAAGGEAVSVTGTSVAKIVDSTFIAGENSYAAMSFSDVKIGDLDGDKETDKGFDLYKANAIENVTVNAHGGLGVHISGAEIYGNVVNMDVVCDKEDPDFGCCFSTVDGGETNIHGAVRDCCFYTTGKVAVEVNGIWGGIEDCVIICDYRPGAGEEVGGTAIHMGGSGPSGEALLIHGIKDSTLSVRGVRAQGRQVQTPRPLELLSASHDYTLDLENVTFYIGAAEAGLVKEGGEYTGAFEKNALHAHVGEFTLRSAGDGDGGRMGDKDGVVEIFELAEPGLIFPLEMSGQYTSALGSGAGIGDATNGDGRSLTLRFMGETPFELDTAVTAEGGIENGELRLENFKLTGTAAASFAGRAASGDLSTVVTLGGNSSAPFVKTEGSARLADNASVSGTVEAGERIGVSGGVRANDVKLREEQTVTLENGGLTDGASIAVTPASWPATGRPVQITTAETGSELYKSSVEYVFSSDDAYTVVTNEAEGCLELRVAHTVTVNGTQRRGKAADGLDYTCEIPGYDADGVYKVTVTVGGKAVEATVEGGAVTVPGESVTGNIDITCEKMSGGAVTLTLDAGEGDFGEDGDGEPVTRKEVRVEAGGRYDLPEPGRTGHSFAGWYTDLGDEKSRVDTGGTVNFTGDTTLYARWTINSYNVAFDLNYGGAARPEGRSVEYAAEFKDFPEVASPRVAANGEKFQFDGWEYTATTALYRSGDSFTMPANDVTFVARWTQIGRIDVEITDPDNRYVRICIKGVNEAGAGFESVAEAPGAKEFTDLPYGVYNVVVEVSDNAGGGNPIVNTFTVELTEPTFTLRVTLPEAYFNYSVETDVGAAADDLENTLDVALDDLKPKYTTGRAVEVKAVGVELTAKELSDQTVAADGDFEAGTDTVDSIKTRINTAAADNDAGLIGEGFTKFVDITVTRTETTYTKEAAGEWTADEANRKREQLTETGELITISFPVTRLGIREVIAGANEELLAENPDAEPVTLGNVVVYRLHGGQIGPMRKVSDAVGQSAGFECYYVHTVTGGDGTRVDYITVKARRFSVYAFGVSNRPVAEQNGTGGASGYPVTIPENVEHGSVTSDHRYAAHGVKVTLTVTPDEGCAVESLTVTDSNGNIVPITDNGDGTYSFTMPARGVTVNVSFHRCPSLRFPDLDVTKWYHIYTDYVIGHGIMNGYDTGLFAPEGNVTRAEMVTALWNMARNVKPDEETRYTDVAEGAWYFEAIQWATEAGVVNGYEDGTFRPDRAITREEMAAMLYRYEKNVMKGGLEEGWSRELAFPDMGEVKDWALEAMSWCAGNGLFEGGETGLLRPEGRTERGELAEILTKYSQLAGEAE